jgi:endo-1,4-beta-xylanase
MNPNSSLLRGVLPLLLILGCLGCSPATPAVPTAVPGSSLQTAPPTPSEIPATFTPAPAPSKIPVSATPLPPANQTGPTRTPWPASAPKLRELAEKRGLYIGGAVQAAYLKEPDYAAAVAGQFNILTPEYELKMCIVWPERERFDFSASDAIVQFALDHHMRVRGHTLVWKECVPDWILNGKFSVEEGKQLLHQYISTVVGRYKGKIQYWDVLNETIERSPIWEQLVGKDYATLAFQWAHEADPDALLFYNDYDIETGNYKSGLLYETLKKWLAAGVPVSGVGFQSHFKYVIQTDVLAENIARFNALGLEVHLTEIDYATTPGYAKSEQDQLQVYTNLMEACLKAPKCPVFILWGVTDKYSWLNKANRPANPLILDADYQPKPAYAALYRLLEGK